MFATPIIRLFAFCSPDLAEVDRCDQERSDERALPVRVDALHEQGVANDEDQRGADKSAGRAGAERHRDALSEEAMQPGPFSAREIIGEEAQGRGGVTDGERDRDGEALTRIRHVPRACGGSGTLPPLEAAGEPIGGGGGGIRTHGTVTRTAVFKTAALNRSATRPG